MERQIIQAAYGFYKGNKTATAQSLGISIRTLDNKLERYQKDKEDGEARTEHTRTAREEQLHYSRFGRPKTPEGSGAAATAKRPTHGDSANGGIRSESASKPSAQHAVSVQEPKEVQGVLPKSHAAGGSGKRR